MSNLNGLRDQLIALRAEQLKAKAESDKAIETIRGLVDNLDTNSLDLLEKYGFYPDFLRNLDVDRLGNDREYLNLFREDLENAIKHLTIAEKLNPNDCEVKYNLGLINEINGNISLAVEKYNEVLRINPNHEEAKNSLHLINEFNESE